MAREGSRQNYSSPCLSLVTSSTGSASSPAARLMLLVLLLLPLLLLLIPAPSHECSRSLLLWISASSCLTLSCYKVLFLMLLTPCVLKTAVPAVSVAAASSSTATAADYDL